MSTKNVHSFTNKYLLNANYVRGTDLGPRDKRNKVSYTKDNYTLTVDEKQITYK